MNESGGLQWCETGSHHVQDLSRQHTMVLSDVCEEPAEFSNRYEQRRRPCPCGSWKKFLGHETPRAQPVSEQTVVYVPVHGVRVEWRHLKFQTGSSTFHILDNKTDLEKGRSRDKSVRCRQSSWVATAGSTVPIGCVTFLTGVLCSDLTLLKRLQGGFI